MSTLLGKGHAGEERVPELQTVKSVLLPSGEGRVAGEEKVRGAHSGRLLPFLELPEADGSKVRVWDYRGRRNLVLFFVHSLKCGVCLELIRAFVADYDEILADKAELLLILPIPVNQAGVVKHQFGLRCPVLADEAGESYPRFGAVDAAGKPRAAVFVADRFGEIYYAVLADREHELPPVADLVGWLDFIEVQCPECGVPHWPTWPG